MIRMQALLFEQLAHLPAAQAALMSGFAIMLYGKLYLTAAGEAYLNNNPAW